MQYAKLLTITINMPWSGNYGRVACPWYGCFHFRGWWDQADEAAYIHPMGLCCVQEKNSPDTTQVSPD